MESDRKRNPEATRERRRSKRIVRRRAEILDAAKQIFLAGEYASVTMDDIADTAGISRATIYLYFKSKQEVYTELLLRDLDAMITMLTTSFDRNDSVRNNLFRMSTSYMNFFRVHPEYFTTLSFFFMPGRKETLPPDAAAKISERLNDGILTIEEAIKLGIARGEARPIDARAATLSLWGQWMGNAYLAVAGRTTIYERTIEQVYADGIDIFLDGLTMRSSG
ncbi:TetR/AcrR family transcriptional regulator [Bradyrhizobium lablabi]|uniref:TetR/AcrR family transcriptional regulator n=1 Tax=Bradyrhizobium lablabi TaxID=722472 RepID=UPI001BAA040D|nr:TetR/AcrR family transcriptional regulator [Bradyrhizobium lablabi]MBR1124896.1 TetR/AcrR family transcriptional regulator [Bradyrhizobium lablabi]